MKLEPFSEKPLVCRPEQGLWFLPVLLMGSALIMPVSIASGARPLTTQDDVWAGVFLVAMLGLPTLGMAWWLLHCRIVADARGLLFQGFFRRRFVAWNAVEDFELRLPAPNRSGLKAGSAYLHSGGKWRHIPDLYGPRQLLLDCIAREAKWARAKAWQLGETRDDGEWPKTFVYRDVSGWRLVATYFLFTFTIFGLEFFKAATYGWAPLLANLALTWNGLSPWGRAGFVALPFLLFGSFPLTILAQYPAIRARRASLNQKIVATRDGLTFHQNGAENFVFWEEISAYHLEPMAGHFAPARCVVETRRASFEFVSGVLNTKILQTLIQERARNAATSKWRYAGGADDDVLGGAASFYRGGSVGVGPKTYHYRTRTTRILLLFGLVACGALLIPIFTGRMTGNGRAASPADIALGIFFLVLVLGMTLGGLAAWFFASLRCEADGLRQNSVWGERFLRWDEIERFTFNGHNFTVSGRKKAIRFGVSLADAQGLKDEIERRSGIVLNNWSQANLD